MSRNPDVELVLREFFGDDGLTAPDHILDVVENRIGRQPQRRSWRLPWRHPMSTTFKLAAGLAAVLVVALVAWRLLPGPGGGIGTQPTPSPTLVPSPSPTSGPRAMTDGPLVAGRYVNDQYGVRLELEVPDGWRSVAGGYLESPDGLAAPDGLGMAFLTPDGLFSDPCRWDSAGTGAWPQPPDVTVGPTAAELATALTEQTAYDASEPVDATVDGNAGKRLDLTFPTELDPTTCDPVTGQTEGVYWPFGGSGAFGGNLYSQGPGQIWRVWIVDLPTKRFVIVVNHFAGTSPDTNDAAARIVDSIRFER